MIGETREQTLKQVEELGKAFQGKQELMKHLRGGRLTMKQAIKANCYECCGLGDNGIDDCEIPTCPLYPFSQYTPTEKKTKKTISESTLKALAHGRAKRRKKSDSGSTNTMPEDNPVGRTTP